MMDVAASQRRLDTYSARRPPSEAVLAAAAALEARCFPARPGGAPAALLELRRALALQRAALLVCAAAEPAHGGEAALLGYALVTWTVGAGRLVKARETRRERRLAARP
jgi:hypothetical protein